MYDYKSSRELSALKDFVTSGYKKETPNKLPQNMSYFDKVQKVLVEFFMKVLKVILWNSTMSPFDMLRFDYIFVGCSV